MKTDFLPINMDELKKNGWKKIDIVVVTCDAYVDHPWYEAVRTARVLVSSGFRVAILSDPKQEDLSRFGKPELFFLLITGKEDSMVMNYSAYKKYRSSDPYQSGGKRSNRPDRATITLTSQLKSLYKTVPVILGGVEAATRRVTHYDYWSNKLRKPILFDSKADLLIFDKLELNSIRLAKHMRGGLGLESLYDQPGVAYIAKEKPDGVKELPSFEDCQKDPSCFIDMYRIFISNLSSGFEGLYQKVMNRYQVINRNHKPYSDEQIKDIFTQGYKNRPHYIYKEGVPIFDKLLSTGIMTHLGDPGNIDNISYLTEGKELAKRYIGDLIKDSERVKRGKHFKSLFRNIGYGKVEQYGLKLKNSLKCETCARYTCFETAGKDICGNIVFNEVKFLELMNTIADKKSVRQIIDETPIDYRIYGRSVDLLKDFIKFRTGSDTSVNCFSLSDSVRKSNDLEPSATVKHFIGNFFKRSGEYGKNRMLKINLVSGAPGESFETVYDTLEFIVDNGLVVGEVRPFIPLPSTPQTSVYYSEQNIFNFESVDVIKDRDMKRDLDMIFNFQKKGSINPLKRMLKRRGLDKLLQLVERYETSRV